MSKYVYEEMTDSRLKEDKKHNVMYLTTKDFEEYKRECEHTGTNVMVTRGTKFKKSSKGNEDNCLDVNGELYDVCLSGDKKSAGYIYIGNNNFVKIIKGSKLPLVIILVILIAAGAFGAFYYNRSLLPASFKAGNDNLNIVTNDGIEMEDDMEWNGTTVVVGGEDTEAVEQESTTIPGFSYVVVTKDAPAIELYNPDENTVNFIYTIVLPQNYEIVDEFESIEEANACVEENTKDYANYFDESTGKYMVQFADGTTSETFDDFSVIENDNIYQVQKATSQMVYFTKGIAPGKKADWDVTKYLSKGSYDLQFRISTFDVETNTACYGASLDVNVVSK